VRRTTSEPLHAQDLAAFVAAVEAASMHGAADALALTQSAVSKRVQALERRLGLVLIERGRFGVRPSEAGRTLYAPAKRALHELGEAERAVLAHREAHPRRLRLSASHTVGEFLLPGWLAAFAQTSTRARTQVEIANSPHVVEAVQEGEAEIGFVEHDDPLEGLQELVLHHDELVVVVAGDHRWAGRASVRVEELADEAFLTRETGSGTRSVALARLARHGLELDPTLETASTQSLKRAVLSGGFTLLSDLTVKAEQQLSTLHALSVEGVELRRRLRAIRRPSARDDEAGRFWAWLSSSAGQALR